MTRLRIPRYRTAIGALAILGALLNVWILTIHFTSVALTSLQADGGGVVICHQGRIITVAGKRLGDENRLPKKHCPICSGLAALHLGVLNEPGLDVALRSMPMAGASQTATARTIDRRPRQTLNRGPPSLA